MLSYEEGGLGFRSLDDISKAFAIKLWRRFRQGQSLWSNYMLSEYCRQIHPLHARFSKSDSHVWKRMLRSRDIAEKNLFLVVGTGNLNARFDKWLEAAMDSRHSTQRSKIYLMTVPNQMRN